ncbi:MAG: tetratricopeptide repeat protein [Prevotellaceae bacterium]|nr:tetratricopeptide repeat protein [Prevotellaceae bacterium]
MKRVLLSIVMLTLIGSAFAQTPEEKAALKAAQKEAKAQMSKGIALRDEVNTLYNEIQAEQEKGEKAKQDLIEANQQKISEKSQEAQELLLTALHSGNIEEKKLYELCNALDFVSSQLLNPELEKASQHEDFDTLLFAKSVDGVCQGCYGVLQYGNPKDETQKVTIANDQLKMPKLMIYYAYLSMFYIETKNIDGAAAALDKYASFASDYPLVADDDAVVNPQYPVSQFAFNLYYTAYEMKDLENCERYYRQALEYDDPESHNFVISSRPQLYKDLGDTIRWKAALEDMAHDYAGEEAGETAMQNLLSIAGGQGTEAMTAEADRLLALYPDSKVANYGKGYSLFAQEKYEEALAYFQKSVEIDPEYIEGNFMAGMTLYRHALENYYQYIDSKKYKTDAEMQEAEEKYVKSYFRQAKDYFETCRALEPDKIDDWAGPLQNIYKNLDETEKAAEMDALLKGQ